MLDVVDKFLEMLFAYGFPIIVILIGILAGFVTLIGLVSLTTPGERFQKLEGVGTCVITLCCCYWYFIYLGDMSPSKEGYSHVGPTLAFFIAFFVWVIPFILKNFFVPLFVSAIVYVGIMIFGI